MKLYELPNVLTAYRTMRQLQPGGGATGGNDFGRPFEDHRRACKPGVEGVGIAPRGNIPKATRVMKADFVTRLIESFASSPG